MGYKQTAHAKLEAIGATIEDDGFTIIVDAPAGKIFSGTGCHANVYDVTDGYTAFGDTKPVWWYISDDLKYGIEDCDKGLDCDYCNS